MTRKSNKISNRWIRETRDDFRAFLDETDFPDPERLGERGPVFKYLEWLVMFIGLERKRALGHQSHARGRIALNRGYFDALGLPRLDLRVSI